MNRHLFLGIFLLLVASRLEAQEYELGDYNLKFSGYSRTRYEFENWYGNQNQRTDYSFPSEKIKLGAELMSGDFRFAATGQYMGIWNLKSDETGPAASYLTNNSGDQTPWAFSLRQLMLEYHPGDFKFTIGRQNYFSGEGGKIDSANRDLNYLSKWRIAQRLIGASEFTAGRSFDGIKAEIPVVEGGESLQFGVFHPTQGAASVDATRQISDIDIGVASYTHAVTNDAREQRGQVQAFYYYYGDSRDLTKVDNRDMATRTTDIANIHLHNFGAHWIQSYDVCEDAIDTTLWGVFQTGDWGTQRQQAWAGVAEIGYHFRKLYLDPWIRTGINVTSGDNSPHDGTHATFSQLINTPRNYALVPIYNMQNMDDRFIQVLLHPTGELTLRSDLHSLALTTRNDLLYSGGGASTVGGFGYSGLPSNGGSNVGTLLDTGATWQFSKYANLDGYIGHVWGGDVLSSNFSNGSSNVTFAYLDLILQFS